MSTIPPHDRFLQEYVRDELRALNAHLPRQRRPLAELLREEHPHVTCNDGGTHLFRKRELEYLAGLCDEEGRQALLLPILIEVGRGPDEAVIPCVAGVSEELLSRVLDMALRADRGRVTIYRPHLALLRRRLKTTTQYVFLQGPDE
ncbi:MAG: DUF61 family protein [Chloroflexota bacterium]|nr:DUF61 family protein [Chloroflexota bacterium]